MSNTIRFDIEAWMFEDYADYLEAVQKGDFELAFLVLHPIIVSWSFDVDLHSERPDLELGFEALPELLQAVSATLEQFIESIDPAEYEVNTKNWKMTDFYAYQDAIRAGEVVKIETLLKKAAKPLDEKYDPAARLSARHALGMKKAIEARQELLFRKRKTR